MTDLLRVNDQIFSWNSCEFKAMGAPFEGIMSIDFDHSRKRKKVMGMRKSGTPLGRTRGKYEPGAVSFRMLATSFDILTDILTPIGAGSYGSAEWVGTLSIAEIGDKPLVYLFDRLVIDSDKVSAAEGIDEIAVDVTCDVMGISLNGKALYSRGLR